MIDEYPPVYIIKVLITSVKSFIFQPWLILVVRHQIGLHTYVYPVGLATIL
jgi:hypothetical protein